jgi:hypothetical protein
MKGMEMAKGQLRLIKDQLKLKGSLKDLLTQYDPAIQEVILGVLSLEQEKISQERPRVKEEIDFIIDVAAKEMLK